MSDGAPEQLEEQMDMAEHCAEETLRKETCERGAGVDVGEQEGEDEDRKGGEEEGEQEGRITTKVLE